MRRWVAALVLPLIISFGLVGCGSNAASKTAAADSSATCPATAQKTLVKTRFAADIGLIVGTTKHFIYTPFKDGKFAKGAHGRLLAIAKAGLAAVAVVHLTHNAIGNAEADPTLCKVLLQPLRDVETALASVKSKIEGGDLSAVTDLNTSVDGLTSNAKSQGLSVVEKVIPGL